MEKRDIFNHPVNVGDYVLVYNTPTHEMIVGQIIKLTPSGIRVVCACVNPTYKKYSEKMFYEFHKISKEEYECFLENIKR